MVSFLPKYLLSLIPYYRLLIRSRNYSPVVITQARPRFMAESVLLIFSVFCVVLSFCVLFVFVLYLVCPMLTMSLDCPFSITPSVFSNGYVLKSGTLKQTSIKISLYCSYIIGIIVQNFGKLIFNMYKNVCVYTYESEISLIDNTSVQYSSNVHITR